MTTADSTTAKLDRLRADLDGLGRVLVACSGGVDSSLLAVVAHQQLGDGALAVTAVSPAVPDEEVAAARELAAAHGLRWQAVQTEELARPGYVANAGDRCYHCRSELLAVLGPLADAESAVIALGTIVDDLGDYRPGLRALAEHGAHSPLADAGLTKDEVRAAARELGIAVWDKPAAPCLASRVPHGTPVTVSTLSRVGRAEAALRRLGFSDLRVRHYGDLARLEVPVAEIGRVVASREAVVAALKAAGYLHATLDLEGLRSGNLNASLTNGAPVSFEGGAN